jgi:ABC-type uncharacterized transport system auxiliary subunit
MNKVVTALWVGIALSGCTGGLRSNAPPEQVYVLHALGPVAADYSIAAVLRVPRPMVNPGLDTDRIALTRGGNELDYFASSRWGAALPKVLGALAVETLARQGGFATVVSGESIGARSDYELLLAARHFEAHYATAQAVPVARVALDCKILAGMPRKVLGNCSAEAEVNAGDNRLGAIVNALEHAAQQALREAGNKAVGLARTAIETAP